MKNSKSKNQLLEKPHDFSRRTQRNSNNNLSGSNTSNENIYGYRQYNRPRMIKLPEEERLKILNGLKKNHDMLSNEYKSISLILDTCTKVKRFIILLLLFDIFLRYYYYYLTYFLINYFLLLIYTNNINILILENRNLRNN